MQAESLRLPQLKMPNISRGNVISTHQPIHGHFTGNFYGFYTVEGSENAIPNTGSYTMIHFRLVKVMIEVMFPEYNKHLSNWVFSVVTGVGIFVYPVHAH